MAMKLRPSARPDAEIAPEARILRCRASACKGASGNCAPIQRSSADEPEIHCEVRGIMTLFILKKRARILPDSSFGKVQRPARLAAFLIVLLSGAPMAWPQNWAPIPVTAPAQPPRPLKPQQSDHHRRRNHRGYLRARGYRAGQGRVSARGSDRSTAEYPAPTTRNSAASRPTAACGCCGEPSRFFGPRLRYNSQRRHGRVRGQSNYIHSGRERRPRAARPNASNSSARTGSGW